MLLHTLAPYRCPSPSECRSGETVSRLQSHTQPRWECRRFSPRPLRKVFAFLPTGLSGSKFVRVESDGLDSPDGDLALHRLEHPRTPACCKELRLVSIGLEPPRRPPDSIPEYSSARSGSRAIGSARSEQSRRRCELAIGVENRTSNGRKTTCLNRIDGGGIDRRPYERLDGRGRPSRLNQLTRSWSSRHPQGVRWFPARSAQHTGW